MAFVRWRRDSGGWIYGLIMLAWCLLSVVIETATGWGWRVYATSAAVFLLLFEVGIATVVAAAWSSHRALELEGEAVEEAIKAEGKRRRQSGRDSV